MGVPLWLVAALLLGGCAVKTTPPVKDYAIFAQMSETASDFGGRFGSIGVDVLRSTRMAGATAVFYRRSRTRIQPYLYARWVEPPAAMVERALVAALLRVHAARSVVGSGSAALPRWRLEVALLDFSQYFLPDKPPYARVEAVVTLSRTSDGRPVGSHRFVFEVPIAGADADGGAQALSEASKRLVRAIVRWLGDEAQTIGPKR